MTVAALWETRLNPLRCARVLGMGVLFGGLALAGLLLYNHLYTGHWLVSPYAMAAGAQAPPELSFNPVRIWQGIAEYGRQTFEMSLIGLFPFAYLLAGYTLVEEREHRREVWILACCLSGVVLRLPGTPGRFRSFLRGALTLRRDFRGLCACRARPRAAGTTLESAEVCSGFRPGAADNPAGKPASLDRCHGRTRRGTVSQDSGCGFADIGDRSGVPPRQSRLCRQALQSQPGGLGSRSTNLPLRLRA